jgi:ankyrin repeat protein
MDYSDIYKNLFDYIKNHKYDKFKEILLEIDPNDIFFDINARDDQNNYLLTYAVNLNLPDIIMLLIERGSRIDITDKHDRSILLIPITFSYLETLEILLKANKQNIGVSIIDIKDRNMKIPLHYAIELKNFRAIELLLLYGSSPNVTDENGQNSLHMAVKTRSVIICELIIKYIADINAKYNTGETALHIACNLQLVQIARMLILNNININIQDFFHEVTALHYSTLLNNKELIAMLLKHNADPNIQDIYGNTCLHYAALENNFECVIMLTNSISTKNIINLNLWNIDGEIPLHVAIKNNISNINDYLDLFLEKSNLSLQNIDGNTCFHFLVQSDLWKEYRSILVKKRLNIFSKNKNNKKPIDFVKEKDMKDFIDMLVESYMWRLKQANEMWYYEWQNICSKEFDNTNISKLDSFIKNKNEVITSDNFSNVCSNIVRYHILKTIKKVNEGKEISCYDTTTPVRKSKICINIYEGSDIDFCTFTGSTLDVLIGLIYLLKKHSDACSTLSKNFTENRDLCAFYKSIGIMITSKCEFLNFEIVWVHQRLYLIEEFYVNFKKCIENKKRFVIIPLGIEMREGSHANYLIYDNKTKEIERFEPHGTTTPPGLHYNPNLLDEILESRFKDMDDTIKYIKPSDYLPKIGFQLMDVNEPKKKKIGDPIGWCALWVVWYVDQRLTYKDIDRKELVFSLLKLIRSKNISFKNMIRNYGKNIIEIRDNILRNSEMNINDWLNDQYTDRQINSVMLSLNKELDELK